MVEEQKTYKLNLDQIQKSDPELEQIIKDVDEKKRKEEMITTIGHITDNAERAEPHTKAKIRTEGEAVLPDDGEFSRWYKNFALYGSFDVVEWNGKVMSLKSGWETISFSPEAVIGLLANKFGEPLPMNANQKVLGNPPFTDDMSQRVKAQIMNVKMEFNRLMAFSDPRIQKLCQDFHATMSFPLSVWIEYLLWEKSLLGWRIEQTMENIRIQHSEAEKTIRDDYNRKKQEELSKKELKISGLESENHRIKIIAEAANGRIQQLKDENRQLEGTNEVVSTKNRDALIKIEHLEAQLVEMKSKLTESEKRIDRLIEAKKEKATVQVEKEVKSKEESDHTPTEEKVLGFLADHVRQSAEQIATGTGVQQNNLYKHLNSLVEEGAIIKEHDDEIDADVFSLAP